MRAGGEVVGPLVDAQAVAAGDRRVGAGRRRIQLATFEPGGAALDGLGQGVDAPVVARRARWPPPSTRNTSTKRVRGRPAADLVAEGVGQGVAHQAAVREARPHQGEVGLGGQPQQRAVAASSSVPGCRSSTE